MQSQTNVSLLAEAKNKKMTRNKWIVSKLQISWTKHWQAGKNSTREKKLFNFRSFSFFFSLSRNLVLRYSVFYGPQVFALLCVGWPDHSRSCITHTHTKRAQRFIYICFRMLILRMHRAVFHLFCKRHNMMELYQSDAGT